MFSDANSKKLTTSEVNLVLFWIKNLAKFFPTNI